MSHFSILTLVLFYLSRFIYLSHSLNNGLSVELIHRDSSKSPIYQPTETKFQRIYNAVHRSINRANHFTKQFSLNTNNPVLTITPDAGEYFISYSIGTPAYKAYGFMDTGSSLIWLQCQPCDTCFNQTSPIFNPSKSSSYKNIQCFSKTCTHAAGEMNTSCSYNDVCEYSMIYDGNFKSQGYLSVETLTLDSTLGSSVSFPNVEIGCGHVNKIPYMDQNSVSGIVGLGNGSLSLIKQLGSSIGSKFSYCLIPVYDESDHSNSTNKLNFGDAAVISGEGVVSTPLVKPEGPIKSSYLVKLEAFSVGNKRIEYGGYKIEGTNAYTRNIIIDSGTTMTLLPQDFYFRLESTVANVVKLPRVDPVYQFKLCYNTTLEQSNIFPVITVHFSGADIKINYNSTFFPIKEGIKCFTFLPIEGSPGYFGNLAQYNLLVVYDLKKSIISFKPTDCTKYQG